MQTDIIRYNLRDRGRQFRGQPRNFNIKAVVASINSDACQEKVRNRDMIGFYGHWPRIKFGMCPREGGLEKGHAIFLEPAIVTTYLKAYPDGTIEHKEEFLETEAGKLVSKLYKSRVGGFSSAIGNGNMEFFGFDYVNEPNYTTNRGYALDSVEGMTMDEVEAAAYGETVHGIMMLIDSVENQVQIATQTVEGLRQENAQLVEMLAAKGIDPSSVYKDGMKIGRSDVAETERFLDDVNSFRNAKALPVVKEPRKEVDLDPVAMRMLNRL